MHDSSPDRQFRRLETIYRWYDAIAWSLAPWACKPGCATCCTPLVSLTTLEAAYLWQKSPALDMAGIAVRSREISLPSLSMTSNEQASLCLSHEDFEENSISLPSVPCPLLANERCLCYEARPLMCRLMFSTAPCGTTGQAEMPSRLLSLTTVCLQLVEHLDRQGWSGYLVHLLPHFQDPSFPEDCQAGTARIEDARLRHNRPNPGFIVPPEHRDQVRRWLEDLHRSS